MKIRILVLRTIKDSAELSSNITRYKRVATILN